MDHGEFVQIEEVNGEGNKNEFIRFPWNVYRGNPHWVPPLRSEVKFLLSKKKNPFFNTPKPPISLRAKAEKRSAG